MSGNNVGERYYCNRGGGVSGNNVGELYYSNRGGGGSWNNVGELCCSSRRGGVRVMFRKTILHQQRMKNGSCVEDDNTTPTEDEEWELC